MTFYGQVRAFIEATDGGTARLTRSQKGRCVALCWIGQILKYFPDPKPAYDSHRAAKNHRGSQRHPHRVKVLPH
jgi:hypothetical protein